LEEQTDGNRTRNGAEHNARISPTGVTTNGALAESEEFRQYLVRGIHEAKETLNGLEAEVRGGRDDVERAFLRMGKALREIRNTKLYKCRATSFGAYLSENEELFGVKRAQAYRLIKAYEDNEDLSPFGDRLPSLQIARILAPIKEPERKHEVLERAKRRSVDGKPSSAIVREEVTKEQDGTTQSRATTAQRTRREKEPTAGDDVAPLARGLPEATKAKAVHASAIRAVNNVHDMLEGSCPPDEDEPFWDALSGLCDVLIQVVKERDERVTRRENERIIAERMTLGNV
jgi:hypothetical protein